MNRKLYLVLFCLIVVLFGPLVSFMVGFDLVIVVFAVWLILYQIASLFFPNHIVSASLAYLAIGFGFLACIFKYIKRVGPR